MDNLVIALCVVVILLYILFFFVIQSGLGLRSKKEKNNARSVFRNLAFGTARHPKGRQLLRSAKMTLTRKDVAL